LFFLSRKETAGYAVILTMEIGLVYSRKENAGSLRTRVLLGPMPGSVVIRLPGNSYMRLAPLIRGDGFAGKSSKQGLTSESQSRDRKMCLMEFASTRVTL
jgi:hypothetical protein